MFVKSRFPFLPVLPIVGDTKQQGQEERQDESNCHNPSWEFEAPNQYDRRRIYHHGLT
jgi:hypothetical protein